MLKEYILQNWSMILILLALVISLNITVFLDKKTIKRTYILIGAIFLLSIIVFFEFYFADAGTNRVLRLILMTIRYSATPFIIAQVVFTLVKRMNWFIFIPAIALAIINIISIFTGIVFRVSEDNVFSRGPLGLLPFIMVGLYCVFLIYLLFKRSNKQKMEIIPIVYLALTFLLGILLPFFIGSSYATIFCTMVAIALFVYYEFSVLQLTKKDALTGLLNRQAYYADITSDPESISAVVTIDMNGLKKINDSSGHVAGDEALTTLAFCFSRAIKRRQLSYRLGGDEFVIICRKNTHEEVEELVNRIRKNVSETKYSVSIGFSFNDDGKTAISELVKKSDEMMYVEKQEYYSKNGLDRRRN